MKVKSAVETYSPKVKDAIRSFFEDKRNQYKSKDFGITSEILQFIDQYTLSEVRQSRPTLFLMGYISSGNKITKDTINTSMVTTFITKYLAIHDDIIDKDTIKNGVPTIHIQSKKFNGSEKMGNDLAILAGDFLWSWAVETILNSSFSPEKKIGALEVICKTNELTNVGQVMDLDFMIRKFHEIKNDEVWMMYTNKAAIYCYVLPLTIGAILGGQSKNVINEFEKFARILGAASQLKDDIEGVFGKVGNTGKSNIVDLRMGVKGLLVIKSFELSNASQRSILSEYIGKSNLTQKQAEIIREIIIKVGGLEYCESMLKTKGLVALKILDKIKKDINFETYEYLDDLVRFRLGLN